MAKSIRFSVVIPAYNVEMYLPDLLQDLLGQTYDNLEVIVVDDCAKDRTAEITEAFREAFHQKDIAYQVIHKEENEGLSSARNTGMESADGDYILFLDGDDRVEKRLLETLADSLEKEPADVVIFGYTEDYYQKQELSYQVHRSPKKNYFGDKGGQPLVAAYPYLAELEQETMLGYAWNKTYRLSLLKEQKIRFSKVVHIEDILFNLEVMDVMCSLLTISEELYHYKNRGQERLTGKYLPDYFELQKRRIRAFGRLQKDKMAAAKHQTQNPLTKQQMECWEERTKQVMAAAYFRGFQSDMVRSICHGDGAKTIFAEGRKQMEDPLYGELRCHLRCDGRLTKILYEPLAKGNLRAAYIRACIIAFVQEHMSGLYVKLKQKR